MRQGGSLHSCVLLTLAALSFGIAGDAEASAPQKGTVAQDARLAGDHARTRFIADLSKKVDVQIFALGDPYRVIVDLPEVNFQMPAGIGTEKRGLVTGYRFGLFAPGKSRIVLDVAGPFIVDKSFVLDERPNQPSRLVIDLVPTDRDTFLASTKDRNEVSAKDVVGALPGPSPSATTKSAATNEKPLVVLDPGHGGVDSGTKTSEGVAEKDVVLAFAKTLKRKIEAKGLYRIVLTRDDDRFLALRERVEFAQKQRADLFVSIHADYSPRRPKEVRGATVYTLSEEASDAEANELAAKENFSDAIAGMQLPSDSDEAVANILIDLAQRETQGHSLSFAKSIVSQMGSSNLHRKAMKSAGFRVLKAPDVPSVLLELGYLSNPEDEKRLTSDSWRAKIADKVAAAIDAYFTKRVAERPF